MSRDYYSTNGQLAEQTLAGHAPGFSAALDFYQRAGFVIKEVVPGPIEEYYGGVEKGFAGVEARDEVRLPLVLPRKNQGE
ncbi:MAG: hypothetical protein WBB22_15735 [Anaerolineae bacterium]